MSRKNSLIQALYRLSKERGGMYCEGCHDSPHAIAPADQPNDAIKFLGWQGRNGPLYTCTVCHATLPEGTGPHSILAPMVPSAWVYLPFVMRNRAP